MLLTFGFLEILVLNPNFQGGNTGFAVPADAHAPGADPARKFREGGDFSNI